MTERISTAVSFLTNFLDVKQLICIGIHGQWLLVAVFVRLVI